MANDLDARTDERDPKPPFNQAVYEALLGEGVQEELARESHAAATAMPLDPRMSSAS